MVEDNESADSRQARREFLEKWSKLCNKIDKDYREIVKNNLDEKVIKKLLSGYDKEKNDLQIIYSRWKAKGKIEIAEVMGDILRHERKLLSALSWLKKIQNTTCYQCKKKLSEKNCHIYLPENQNITKWTIEKVNELDPDLSCLLFCSINCYKQSIYYSSKTKSNQSKPATTNQPSKQSSSQTQKEYLYCRECTKDINSTYYYHTTKNDNHKFCSEQCFTNYYGEYCLTCKPCQKYLDIYRLEEGDMFGYCWDCYQEQIMKLEALEREKETIEEKPETEDLVEKHFINETCCKFCSEKLPNRRFFPVCDKEECKKKFWNTKEQINNQYSSNSQERERERENLAINPLIISPGYWEVLEY